MQHQRSGELRALLGHFALNLAELIVVQRGQVDGLAARELDLLIIRLLKRRVHIQLELIRKGQRQTGRSGKRIPVGRGCAVNGGNQTAAILAVTR